MVGRGDHVLVALSGGADSVATLAALCQLAPRLGIRLSAAHVNHGLRAREADRDADFAASIAEHFGVPFRLLRLSSSLGQGGNTEARAREARYAALADAAVETHASRIATGHTRDDQAETVLLRIVRGCGPTGLAAIRPIVLWYGRPVIRPLLDCGRRDVEAFLKALNLTYCEDSSNRDRRFLRNRIRHDVLPLLRELNPRVDRALADLASLSRTEGPGPEATVAGDTALSVAAMRGSSPEVRGETIRQWLTGARGATRGLARKHVAAILELLGDGRPNRRVDVSGGSVLREYDRLRYAPRAASGQPSVPEILYPGQSVTLAGWRIDAGPVESAVGIQRLPEDLWSAIVDADAAGPAFVVRPPMAGDRVVPCGMAGHRKLSDVFVDRKVPLALRRDCPIVQIGADVLWVPGVVRSAMALVGCDTQRVVWLRAESSRPRLLG